MDQEHGRFIIDKPLRNSNKWENFDETEHIRGYFILWPFTEVRKFSDDVENLGTEARPPIPLEERKQRRNQNKWKKNTRKNNYRAGKPYSYKNNKKEVVEMKDRTTLDTKNLAVDNAGSNVLII